MSFTFSFAVIIISSSHAHVNNTSGFRRLDKMTPAQRYGPEANEKWDQLVCEKSADPIKSTGGVIVLERHDGDVIPPCCTNLLALIKFNIFFR